MIPKDTVNRILEVAEIVDVVSDFVALKKRGANYLGNCPFHNEKSPSFTVSAAKGIYKCFGCGKAGTPVNFIMEHEQLSFPDALRFLAKKYAIKIEEQEQTADDIKEQNAKESMMLLSTYAQQQFTINLFEKEEGKTIGLSYFKERGFSKTTIDKFQLGFALESRKAFTEKAIQDGYLLEYLVKTGLTIEGENGNFDRFAGRVIFPIHNLSGRVIAFGGRILVNDKKAAKYLNSPESEIYHKSNVLYGIYFAKKTIVEKNNCFLVEGYTDVVSLVQAGVENVVASAGTSLTVEQIRLIRRFTKNITILYDGDNAGIKASFRGIDLVLSEGMNVRVLLFPEGEDPDSYAKRSSQDELLSFIEKNTTDFISFKTKLLLDETKNDPIQKAALINEIVESIALMPDSIARSLYVKECSRLMKVDEQLLISVLNKSLQKNRLKQAGITQTQPVEELTIQTEQAITTLEVSEFDTEAQEWEIIRLMINHGSKEIEVAATNDQGLEETMKVHAASYICAALIQNEIAFNNPENQTYFEGYVQEIEKSVIPEVQQLTSHEIESIRNITIKYLHEAYQLSHGWNVKYKLKIPEKDEYLSKLVLSVINKLKQKKLIRIIQDLQDQIKACEDETEILGLLAEMNSLIEVKKLLYNETGTTIIH